MSAASSPDLRSAIEAALNELGVPQPGYQQPVANAVAILRAALALPVDAEGLNEGQARALAGDILAFVLEQVGTGIQGWQLDGRRMTDALADKLRGALPVSPSEGRKRGTSPLWVCSGCRERQHGTGNICGNCGAVRTFLLPTDSVPVSRPPSPELKSCHKCGAFYQGQGCSCVDIVDAAALQRAQPRPVLSALPGTEGEPPKITATEVRDLWSLALANPAIDAEHGYEWGTMADLLNARQRGALPSPPPEKP